MFCLQNWYFLPASALKLAKNISYVRKKYHWQHCQWYFFLLLSKSQYFAGAPPLSVSSWYTFLCHKLMERVTRSARFGVEPASSGPAEEESVRPQQLWWDPEPSLLIKSAANRRLTETEFLLHEFHFILQLVEPPSAPMVPVWLY